MTFINDVEDSIAVVYRALASRTKGPRFESLGSTCVILQRKQQKYWLWLQKTDIERD